MFKLGFIVNPIAGVGGSVALKGSDDIVKHALALGAKPKANIRAKTALKLLLPYQNEIIVYTVNDQMGEQTANELGFKIELVYRTKNNNTQASDTEKAVAALIAEQVDIILFTGGDGTARNIAKVVAYNAEQNEQPQIPVLGIPAGCKIHSGVYAITPTAAGRVIELMLTKQLVTLTTGDVMDIDETLFRQGIVKAKRFGEMQIPSELRYVQAVKSGGKEHNELVLHASNVTEKQLWNKLLQTNKTQQRVILIITLIGGQGHIFGRGNQQLSPRIIRFIIKQHGGKENILIIATKAKLTALDNRPLISDTGDNDLDQLLSGFMPIITGYKDQVLYPVSSPL